MKKEFLSKINQIDWTNFKSGYGNPSLVPKYFELILSEDENTINKGFEELGDVLMHQGTIYQVTGHIMPFIIFLIKMEHPFRDSIIELLVMIKNGYNSEDCYMKTIHSELEKEASFFEDLLKKENDFYIKGFLIQILS